jgi:hypothetical protein
MTWSPFLTSHAGAGFDDDARALMPKNRREQSFRIGARQGEFIGVADAGCPDFNQDFAGARAVKLDCGDFKGLAGRKRDGGANVHEIIPQF